MFKKHINPSVSKKAQSLTLSQPDTHESDGFGQLAVEIENFNINTKTPENAKKIRKNPKYAKHSSKLIAPKGNTHKGLPYIDQDNLECSCDGVPMLPIKLGSYNYIIINTAESEICREAGIGSYTRNSDGETVECVIIKTEDAFAIVIRAEGDDKPRLQWIMDRIDFVKKVKGDDGIVYVDIKVNDDLGEKVIRVPRTFFEKNGINSLSKYNISIFSDYTMPMAIYFKKILDEMPMEDASQVLGVVKNADTKELEFNGYGENGLFKIKNQYKTYREYIKHFNPLLERSKPLQYLLAASMSAPVLTVLQQKYNYDLHSYCINVVGSSSTGKTICNRVCASAWTNPTDKNIFSSMNSTHNSAIQRLSGRYGVPTFYDESTNDGDIKADKYAYSIYNEQDKGRLNRDGSEKASGTWSSIVFMSSEEHFHNNAKNQNGGLTNRVHNMDNHSWTASKKHADELENFIKNNYGVIGRKFTKLLFNKDNLNVIEDLYAEAKEIMNAYCKNDYGSFTDRLCKTYALTYMTAVMLKKMGLAINVEAVAEIMVKHNATVSDEQNLAKNAFNAIVSYVACGKDSRSDGIRRYNDDKCNLVKVAIIDSVMNNILVKAGFKDMKVAIKELDKAGYLIRQEEKGLKSKLTINNTLCFCYQIDMTSLLDDPECDTEDLVEFVKGKNATMLAKKDTVVGIDIYDDAAEDEADTDLTFCFDKSIEDEDSYDVSEDEAEVEEDEADTDLTFCFDKSIEDEDSYDVSEDEAEAEEDEADDDLTFCFDKSIEDEESYDISEDEAEAEEDEDEQYSIFYSTEPEEDNEYSDEDEYVEIDWDSIPVHLNSQWGSGYDNDNEGDDEDEYSDYE